MDDQLRSRIHRFLAGATGARANEMHGTYAVATTVGLVRAQNQDAALIVRARYGASPARDFDLAIVCDGLGGMKQGREAAVLGLSAFVARLLRTARVPLADRAKAAMMHANEEIHHLLRGAGGTTMSAVITVRSGPAVIVHAGDSRVYGLGGKDELEQLTVDDTLDALRNKHYGDSADRDSRILQFVGMGEDLEPHVLQMPENVRGYLLTSDGAHDLPVYLMARAAACAKQPSDLPRRLIQISELLGGLDNATVAFVPVRPSAQEVGSTDGLDLSIISPFGSLNAWIPHIFEERRELGAIGLEPTKRPSEDNRNPPKLEPRPPSALWAGTMRPRPETLAAGPPQEMAAAVRSPSTSATKGGKRPRKRPPPKKVGPDDNLLRLPPAAVNIRLTGDGE